MRRWGSEEWAGIAMLAVCVGVSAPGLVGAASTAAPWGVWVATFAVMMTALVVASVHDDVGPPSTRRVAAYAVAVVGSWVVVVTGPSTGLVPVLVVLVAALAPGLVSRRVTTAVVVLNTAVLLGHWWSTGMRGWELVVGTGFYALIQIASVLSVVTVQREQVLRRELAEAHVGLQAASVLLEDSARSAERLRISRDLHDLLGHQLTVLSLELEAARHREGAAAAAHVERAHGVARELLADVRETVGSLRTPATDLEEALRSVGRGVPGLEVSVAVEPGVVLEEHQVAAFVRATQEIVTNALRHSGARELWVEVGWDGDAVRLVAGDDGRGVARVRPGNGLRGLAERFAALGGSVEYDGAAGFTVTARVPVG